MLIETCPLVVSTCSSRTLKAMPGCLDGRSRPVQLRRGADEDADLVRQHAVLDLLRDPVADRLDLLALGCRGPESSAAGR